MAIKEICLVTLFVLIPAVISRHVDHPRTKKGQTMYIEKKEGGKTHEHFHYRIPQLRIRNSPSELISLPLFESKTLECEAGGNPPPTIHWLRNGHRLSQNEAKQEASLDDGNEVASSLLGISFTKSRLFLDCVSPMDEGTYTCVAENPYYRLSSDTSVAIQKKKKKKQGDIGCVEKKSFGKPARIHMWTHSRLEMVSSNVQLFCRSEGYPDPEVHWIGPRNKSLKNKEKYEILDNGDLVIKNIGWEDMGDYTCISENPLGTDRVTTFLYPTMTDK